MQAHTLQDIIRQPSTQDYIAYVEDNLIPYCPISKADIMHVEDIFGASVGTLKGKMTRKKSERVIINNVDLPEGLEKHDKITLKTDIMYRNGITFIMTISKGINFCTAELIKNEKANTIAKSINQVLKLYNNRGFNIQNIMADWQFEKIRRLLDGSGTNLNITGHDEQKIHLHS